MKPTYFKPVQIRRRFGVMFDRDGNELNEKEKGLELDCEEGGKHDWLLLPYKEGHKEYIQCLKCHEVSHF